MVSKINIVIVLIVVITRTVYCGNSKSKLDLDFLDSNFLYSKLLGLYYLKNCLKFDVHKKSLFEY